MNDIVFLDTEVMGLNPAAPVWEFAAVRVTAGLPVEKREFFIEHDPGDWIGDMPTSFADDYRNRYRPLAAYSEARAVEEIHFITNGAVVIGCNPGFDIERLTSLMRRNGIEPAWHYHPEDIASMAAGYLAAKGICPPRPWKSDQLSRRLGVDPAAYARHTAMGDVRWCQAQYQAVMSDPRILTQEQLAAVPVGSIVRSDAGTIACRYDAGWGVVFGDERPFHWRALALPAQRIWNGSAA